MRIKVKTLDMARSIPPKVMKGRQIVAMILESFRSSTQTDLTFRGKHLYEISPCPFPFQNQGTCVLLKMVLAGHFLVRHEGRALAFFSSKHFWHSLKKHIVGFQVVFKNQ